VGALQRRDTHTLTCLFWPGYDYRGASITPPLPTGGRRHKPHNPASSWTFTTEMAVEQGGARWRADSAIRAGRRASLLRRTNGRWRWRSGTGSDYLPCFAHFLLDAGGQTGSSASAAWAIPFFAVLLRRARLFTVRVLHFFFLYYATLYTFLCGMAQHAVYMPVASLPPLLALPHFIATSTLQLNSEPGTARIRRLAWAAASRGRTRCVMRQPCCTSDVRAGIINICRSGAVLVLVLLCAGHADIEPALVIRASGAFLAWAQNTALPGKHTADAS